MVAFDRAMKFTTVGDRAPTSGALVFESRLASRPFQTGGRAVPWLRQISNQRLDAPS